MAQEVICPYCNQTAALVTGREVYPHRRDLYGKRFYQCLPCNAYVGCHDGTERPLGRLANAELRIAKMQAHDAFDPRWRTKDRSTRAIARTQAYNWLAKRLGVSRDECHIGMFDVERCRRVVEICRDSNGVLRHQTEMDAGEEREAG